MFHLLLKPIPAYGAFVMFLSGAILTALLIPKSFNPNSTKKTVELAKASEACDVTSIRLRGFEYIRPLLYVESACESADLSTLKQEIENTLTISKKNGLVERAAVYVRDFDHAQWISIGDQETFHPGSMFKIPMLFAWLHLADQNPEILNKSFLFEGVKGEEIPVQNYVSGTSLEKGRTYTVKQLLQQLIAYSDNEALWLLKKHLPDGVMEQTFVDLGIGIPIPSAEDNRIHVTAKEISTFMRVLLNSSYLNTEHSELALHMLAQSKFKEGFLAGLPSGIKLAHKFGEWDDGQTFELHETGIIYLKNRPFLITVMSQGAARNTLPGVLSAVTRTVYEQLIKKAN